MSKVNRGKQFEQQVKKNFLDIQNTSVYRLQDSMGGFAGVTNICDFIIYHYPHQFFLECKCHYGNTLPFNCITDNQMQGMYEMSKIEGVKAGVLVWYIDHDATYFLPIQFLVAIKQTGAKSINIKDLVDIENSPYIKIPSIKKRVLCEYNFNILFN